jgi:hypothetical protein
LKKLISINEFYSVRIGSASTTSSGDYIDNIHKNEWVSIAYCGDDNDILLVEGAHFKTKVYKHGHFWEICKIIPNQSSIDSLLIIGLLRSAVDRDFDGLVDSGISESLIFFAKDTDAINTRLPINFAVCSLMSSFTGIFFDADRNSIVMKDKEINELNDLYGFLEEDESWVVGFLT